MSKPPATLAVSGMDQYTVAITPQWQQQRDQKLEEAAFITEVSNVPEQTLAVVTAAELKRIEKDVEATREELKKPLLEASRALDQTAREAVAQVKMERQRIEQLVADFHQTQERARQAAERERLRLQREAEKQAAVLEADRIASLKTSMDARNKADRETAATEARRIAEQQEQEALKSFDAPPATKSPEVVKPKGASVENVIKFEVESIEELYKAARWLVSLTPRTSEINYHLKTLSQQGMPVILPGLRVWQETKVTTKAANGLALQNS